MRLGELLNDVTGLADAESIRTKCQALSSMLTNSGHPITPKGVEKWFERDSLPSRWLVRILQLPKNTDRTVDIKDYI